MTQPIRAICDGCGLCCMEMRTPPFDSDEISDLPKWLRGAFRAQRERCFAEDTPECSPCFWLDLDTKQCKQYLYRPFECRDFQPASAGCNRHRGIGC